MCGIVGAISNASTSIVSVINGLSKLQNRGYDSSGISYINKMTGNIKTLKKIKTIEIPSPVSWLKSNIDDADLSNSNIAVGHTRWATHGSVTIENTHPHYGSDKSIQLVHNGIIENYLEMRTFLLNLGYHFYGETDSEVVAKYLSYLKESNQRYEKVTNIMKGSWAILFIDSDDPNRIYFMKNGSPLVLGYTICKNKIMLVSEISAFDSYIERYINLSDNEFGYIEENKIVTTNIYTDNPVNSQDYSTLGDYPHWTLKEIYDQKCVIDVLIENFTLYMNTLEPIRELLRNEIEHVIFLACGTSYHAAKFSISHFKQLNSKLTFEVIDGAEFTQSDIPDKKCVVIVLSQSGETKDLFHGIDIANDLNIVTIGLINVEESTIAKKCKYVLYLKAGRENAVASTKVFLSQIVLLRFLSDYFANNFANNFISNFYFKLSNSVKHMLNNDVVLQQIHTISEKVISSNSMFILGRQNLEWIAKEGSLKIKEISYIHTEGYSAHALKHGPFALLDNSTPVIVLINSDEFENKLMNVINEINSRSAPSYIITNSSDIHKKYNNIMIDTDEHMFPYLSVIALQLLAYNISIKKGLNPDFPRNLAKVVTVE